MRAASRVCALLADIAGRPAFEEPSHTTVQNFILRIGLYLLQRNDLKHDDWILIADHTIGAGTTKCFIVLGIRHSDYLRLERPLQHRDMQTLALIPVEQSTGAVVQKQLNEIVSRYGVPFAMVSDHGSDLKKGLEMLQQKYPSVIALYDIVHLVSRLIEKLLTSDDSWSEYRKACCECANHVRQSKLSHLKPPRPKTKARYMNVDPEIRWGTRALAVLDRVRQGTLTTRQQERLPRHLVEEKLGWLDEYRGVIAAWQELVSVGQCVSSVIRRHGYGVDTMTALRTTVDEPLHRDSKQLLAGIQAVIEPMCKAASNYTSLPGSSEVLESLIGKGKRLLGTSINSNSLTRQVLAIATATATITSSLVREALSTCRIKHLKQWTQDNIVDAVHRLRREDLQCTPSEQNLRNLAAPATPTF